ncbi:MAG: hypothetical protein ABIL02_00295 [candidate division WOR-3 bacterium]
MPHPILDLDSLENERKLYEEYLKEMREAYKNDVKDAFGFWGFVTCIPTPILFLLPGLGIILIITNIIVVKMAGRKHI